MNLLKNEYFNEDVLKSLLESEIDDYFIETNIGSEITVLIDKIYSSKLNNLLNKLEKYKVHVGIVSYGISTATLEEIFLKFNS